MTSRTAAWLAAACVILLAAPGAGATPPSTPVPTPRLRVELDGAITLDRLLEAGLDVVNARRGRFVEVLAWPGDRATLERLGARVTVLEADVEGRLARRAAADLGARPRRSERLTADGTSAPPPVGAGSMGGYWTLDEVKQYLDARVANDANGVVADKLDTLGWSLEGRPIWGLALRAAAGPPGPRPLAYFNALTHAREPAGMQALLYFVDDVVARYPLDPWAKMLLEQRELYIVPVVNPDGYELNRAVHPTGGGLHRKNLRDNDNDGFADYGSDGVDLNRNFPYQWGLNNVGSSPFPNSQTYRGPSAGSESETAVQMSAVVARQPKTGLSFHTFSDLFVHPWGYTTTGTPDSLAYQEWDDELTLGNGYAAGPAPRVLYSVNGEFNDWCYGETVTKPRARTWTPEVGNPIDDFWPPPSRIVPLCEESLRACWIAASIAGAWVRAESASLAPALLPAGHVRQLAIRARNRGLAATGAGLVARLTSLDPGVEVFLDPTTVAYPDLAPLTSGDAVGGGAFTIATADTVSPGRLVRLLAEFTTPAGHYSRDTIELVVGVPTTLLDERAESLAGWTSSGGWAVVADDAGHLSRYFADSPAGVYGPGASSTLTRTAAFDLSAGSRAWLELEGRWGFESDWDAGTIEASFDGVTWQPLASRATTQGLAVAGGFQAGGQPVIEGTRWRWAPERFDLAPFAGPAGTSVRLRVRVAADSLSQLDGWALDSLRVQVYDPAAQPGPTTSVTDAVARLELAPPAPNPARSGTHFEFVLPHAGDVRLELFDPAGRRIRRLVTRALDAGRYRIAWSLTDEGGRSVAPGLYLARLAMAGASVTRRVTVTR